MLYPAFTSGAPIYLGETLVSAKVTTGWQSIAVAESVNEERAACTALWQCTFSTGSVQQGRITKCRNNPLSQRETFHRKLAFVSRSTMSGILQVSLLSGKLHSSFCQHLHTQLCVDFGAVAVFRGNQNNKKWVLENNHRTECVSLGETIGRIFSLSHSSGPARFATTSLARGQH